MELCHHLEVPANAHVAIRNSLAQHSHFWTAKSSAHKSLESVNQIIPFLWQRFHQPNHSHYTFYIWEVWHIDACWYILAPTRAFLIRSAPTWQNPACEPGMQVSQAFKFRRFGTYLVASSILIHHFGSIKLFPPWCILLVRFCVFSSLQNNIAFFWYHEPPCLNKPITLTLIQGWPIDPDPFSSRLYYDQWHSPNLPSQLNDVDPGSGIVNKNLLGWTPKNYISPWFSLKTREISLFKRE